MIIRPRPKPNVPSTLSSKTEGFNSVSSDVPITGGEHCGVSDTERNLWVGLRLFGKHEPQDISSTNGISGSKYGHGEVLPAGLT